MKALIKGGNIYIDNILINRDKYYGQDYIDYINCQSKRFESEGSIFANELFYSFYVNKICMYEYIFQKERIEEIVINDSFSKNKYIHDAATNLFIKVKQPIFLNVLHSIVQRIYKLESFFKLVIYMLLTIGYMTYQLIKNAKQGEINKNKKFAIIHCKAGLYKIKKYFEFEGIDALLFIDPKLLPKEYAHNQFSVFSLVSKSDYFKTAIEIFKQSYVEYKKSMELILKISKKNTSYYMLKYFSKRIPHYVLTKRAMSNILDYMTDDILYHTEKESRWAIAANILSLNKNKTTIGIPHGLEYGIKFPHGIFGDKVYCTSVNAQNTMKKLYSRKLFDYNSKIQESIYKSGNNTSSKKKIVYFTEGRNLFKDERIINELIRNNINFQIKLHPLDSISNYNLNSTVNLIYDYSIAISNNICVARNSSVLLEAIYNNSISISVLLDAEDMFICNYLYPSLSNKDIMKVYNITELISALL